MMQPLLMESARSLNRMKFRDSRIFWTVVGLVAGHVVVLIGLFILPHLKPSKLPSTSIQLEDSGPESMAMLTCSVTNMGILSGSHTGLVVTLLSVPTYREIRITNPAMITNMLGRFRPRNVIYVVESEMILAMTNSSIGPLPDMRGRSPTRVTFIEYALYLRIR